MTNSRILPNKKKSLASAERKHSLTLPKIAAGTLRTCNKNHSTNSSRTAFGNRFKVSMDPSLCDSQENASHFLMLIFSLVPAQNAPVQFVRMYYRRNESFLYHDHLSWPCYAMPRVWNAGGLCCSKASKSINSVGLPLLRKANLSIKRGKLDK